MPEIHNVQTVRGEVEFLSYGAGMPVLVFHGGQSNCNEQSYTPILDPMRFRLLVPSRPGYGGTPLATNGTASATADLFVSLLDSLEIERALTIGSSLGGRSAVEFAARHPDRTLGLALGSAVTGSWLTPREIARNSKIFAPGTEAWVWATVRGAFRVAPKMMARTLLKQFTTVPIQRLARADLEVLGAKVRLLRSHRGFVADLAQALPEESLRAVVSPTFVQHSAYDNSVPVAHAERAKALVGGAQLTVYDNDWGHQLFHGPGSAQPIADLTAFAESL